jgi:arylsulfatase
MTKRRNILWICTDQQRFDTLGCCGNEFVRTPNLDRLAEDGVLFTHAYAQCTVCAPSRASFLTGRYPRTTRCRQNGQPIPADEVLVTRVLHDAGYAGGLSGKLHISACHPDACKTMERRIDDGYDEFHWSHHPGPDWPANEYMHWLREKGVEYGTAPIEGYSHVCRGMPGEHHHTTWCADKAIDFIEGARASDAPWFFSVNFFDPHHQFDPPEDYLARYLDRLGDVPLPTYASGELDGKPIWQRIDHKGAYGGGSGYAWDTLTEDNHRMLRAAYWAMCDLIDAQAGRMLEALDRTGQRENTIVIFMSDHGEMLGDHGIYLKGPYFYEPAVRVPLIVAWPGTIEPGRRCDALVELVDLAPALLDAAGLAHPPGMQGRSLWPIMAGSAALDHHRDDVYCEFYGANSKYEPRAHATMVRNDTYKIVAAHEQNTGELYDLEEDPTETHNRWADPEYTAIRLEMLTRLCDRMAWTADPLPIREAPW